MQHNRWKSQGTNSWWKVPLQLRDNSIVCRGFMLPEVQKTRFHEPGGDWHCSCSGSSSCCCCCCPRSKEQFRNRSNSYFLFHSAASFLALALLSATSLRALATAAHRNNENSSKYQMKIGTSIVQATLKCSPKHKNLTLQNSWYYFLTASPAIISLKTKGPQSSQGLWNHTNSAVLFNPLKSTVSNNKAVRKLFLIIFYPINATARTKRIGAHTSHSDREFNQVGISISNSGFLKLLFHWTLRAFVAPPIFILFTFWFHL